MSLKVFYYIVSKHMCKDFECPSGASVLTKWSERCFGRLWFRGASEPQKPTLVGGVVPWGKFRW